ncbi:hypothetical protein KEM56_000129 [Ascosphaera pollenicola]|nr:hypothetical protein KEM56_000129 [Ascosphaera pollenicola]
MAPPTYYLVFVLLALACAVSAATSPQSFCKCTCFSNSSIIELDHFKSSNPNSGYNPSNPDSNISCNDCTRKFCLEYAQPACEGAKEEDITTECFQRDSNKDKVIVYLFIVTVMCLLGYAAIKPKADKWFALLDLFSLLEPGIVVPLNPRSTFLSQALVDFPLDVVAASNGLVEEALRMALVERRHDLLAVCDDDTPLSVEH